MNKTTPERIVILGAGQAGAWAANTLRSEGYDGEVILVGEESHAPYERPPLSKAQLKEACDAPSAPVMLEDALALRSITWRRGTSAQALDLRSRRVGLSDGTALTYEKLIFCTGGRALRPPIAGIEQPGVFTLRTIEDCARLGNSLRAASRICVIGGGWIGLEVAATAKEMGKAVTLLHKGDRLCDRALPAEGSKHLLRLHHAAGVDVRLNSDVQAIVSHHGGLAVYAADGTCTLADLVLLAVGMSANDELAVQAGLACDRGILVDAQCRTSDPHVFASGDVAVAPNSWAGKSIRLESWQNATDQSIVAARNAMGRDAMYDPLPWFWSDQFGVNLQMFGWPQPHHRVVSRKVNPTGSRLLFLLDGRRIEAVIAIDAPREARMGRKLIEGRFEVRDDELGDPGIGLSTLQTAGPLERTNTPGDRR